MKKVFSFLGGFVSFCLCILLFVIQVSFLLLVSFKGFITKDSIYNVLENMDVQEIIENSDMEIDEDLYEITDAYGISRSDTDKIMNSDALKEFVASYVTINIDSIVNEKQPKNITTKDLNVLIDDVIKETEIKIETEKVSELKKYINENSEEVNKILDVSDEIKENLDEETISMFRFMFSATITYIFIIVLVIFYFLIALFRWSIYKPLIWYGVSLALSSLILIAIALGLKTGLYLIDAEVYREYYDIISNVITASQKTTLIYGLISLAISIVMIVLYALIRKNQKEKLIDKEITEKTLEKENSSQE